MNAHLHPETTEFKGYTITTDKSKMHVDQIHKWLSEESYWCTNVPHEIVKGSFDNSFCVGIIKENTQIGFARLITDYTTFGYLADVFVLDKHRGQGLSKAMLDLLFGFEWVKKLRGIRLMTRDGHGLYQKVGFTPLKFPDRLMELTRPNIYTSTNNHKTN